MSDPAAPARDTTRPLPFWPAARAVFEEVDRAHVDFGVVPIENSTDGRIADTLEMFLRMRHLTICGEIRLRIHHNLVANWHRRQGRHQQSHWEHLEEAPGANVGNPDNRDADALFNRHLLLSALRLLEEDRQALLVYKFGQGLSNAEIAAILGRTEGAVKSLYHRTLSELRAQLGTSPDTGPTTESAP